MWRHEHEGVQLEANHVQSCKKGENCWCSCYGLQDEWNHGRTRKKMKKCTWLRFTFLCDKISKPKETAGTSRYDDVKKSGNTFTVWGTCRFSLTGWSSPRGSSGFSVAQPITARRWCQRWRRRRSRAAARYPAWAECRAAGSPGSAYLWSSADGLIRHREASLL